MSITIINTREQFDNMTKADQRQIIKQLTEHDKQNTFIKSHDHEGTWPFVKNIGLWPLICRVDAVETKGRLKLEGYVHAWDAAEVEIVLTGKEWAVNLSPEEIAWHKERWREVEYPDVLLERFGITS